MAADKLTVDNFILRIKQMDERERKKIRAPDLIELILQLPDDNDFTKQTEKINSLEMTVQNLCASFEIIKTDTSKNAAEILILTQKNIELKTNNEQLTETFEVFKEKGNQNFFNMQEDINLIHKQLNEIEQYLRVNNLEIVGLPEPNENESETEMIVEALNTLQFLQDEIRIGDVDIAHPIPTKRRDNKRVSVIKFISRFTKFDILQAKKQDRNIKFRNRDLFINEHLSPTNRALFARASEIKREQEYKFLWTKNGVPYMRQNETSEIFAITCDEDLYKLPPNIQNIENIENDKEVDVVVVEK